MPFALNSFNQKTRNLPFALLTGLGQKIGRAHRQLILLGLAMTASWVAFHPPRLAHLFDASSAIQLHVFAAVLALLVGTVLLVGVKGTGVHRRLGWVWVLAMLVVTGSTLFIHEINTGGFSPIHGLSAWVLISLPFAVVAARKRNIRAHSRAMTGMFVGGLIIAGLFTFLPGRLMYEVFFR